MSDTTPLLVDSGLPPPNTLQDHRKPAFLRAAHSPWRWIPQNILVILRGIVLAYLVALGVTGADYKLRLESDDSVFRHLFDFSIISYSMVLVYHIITFSWTFTHLYHPDADQETGIEGFFVRLMSLPRNMGSLKKQFYFTMFYTASAVFAFMNSTIYWFITRPHDLGTEEPSDPELLKIPKAPFSDLFGENWYKGFNVFNLYGVTSVIMVIEILLLNSIRRTYAVGSHLFGLVVSAGLYLGWAFIGKAVTGWDAFFWLDTEEVGSREAVTTYSIGFVLLAPLMYILMQGFTSLRESLTALANKRDPEVAEPLDE